MIKRRTSKKRNLNTNIKAISYNIIIGLLSVLIITFLFSSIKQMFFSYGTNIDYPDLSQLITKTPYEKQTGHKIQIEIRNGCGVSNLALMYTDFLRSEGFDVIDSKNADNWNYSETIILHHRGNFKRAMVLADLLNIEYKKIKDDKNENLFYDLTLIVGKDYINLDSYRNAVLFQPPF